MENWKTDSEYQKREWTFTRTVWTKIPCYEADGF